jgi:hypothetical protein
MPYTIDDALKLTQDCLKLAEKVGDAAIASRTELGGLGALFLARAGQSQFSAGLLAQNGLNADAMSVARTVTEMSIDFAYIALDPTPRIKLFQEYDAIPKYEMALAINELHGGTVDPEAMRALKERHDKAQLNNPNRSRAYLNWAGRSIRKRAIDADRKQLYALPYADACSASHSGHGTLEYALVDLDTNPKMRFGRMPPSGKAIDLAFASMTLLIASVIEACKLDKSLGEDLTQLLDRRRTYSQ